MTWENAFWARDGYEVMLKHMRAGSEAAKIAAKALHEKAAIDAEYSRNLTKLSKSFTALAKEDFGTLKTFWESLRTEIENQARLVQAAAQSIENDMVKAMEAFREEQLKARAVLDKKYLAAEKSYSTAKGVEQKARKNSYAYAKILETAAEAYSRAQGNDKELPKADKNYQKAKKDSEAADKEFKAAVRKVRATKLTWEETFLTCCLEYQGQESQRIIHTRENLVKFCELHMNLHPQLLASYDKIHSDVNIINEQNDLEVAATQKATGDQRPEEILYTTYAFDARNTMNPQRRAESLAQTIAELEQEVASEEKGLAGVENLLKVYKDQPSFANDTTRITSEHQLNNIKDYLSKLQSLIEQYEQLLNSSGGSRSAFQPRAISPDSTPYDSAGYDDAPPTPPTIRASIGSSKGSEQCRALYDFVGTNEGELTVREGDVLKIIAKDDPEWWTVELNGEQGFVPNTYVEII